MCCGSDCCDRRERRSRRPNGALPLKLELQAFRTDLLRQDYADFQARVALL